VVESVERHIRGGLAPREAAIRTMEEVSGALVAIGLVLMAVFIPSAFLPGIPGQFYRQFAATIASASAISLLVSLTLSPALAALLLRAHADSAHAETHGSRLMAPLRAAARLFNTAFDWVSDRYGKLTAQLVRTAGAMLFAYAFLLFLTGWRYASTPTGFIPQQDQGYLIGAIQLPPGASLERTDAVTRRAVEIISGTPGVITTAAFAGFDGASFSAAPNAGVVFVKLEDFEKRSVPSLSADALSQTLTDRLRAIEEANIFMISPPPVPGLGTGGGFKMMIEDRSGAGLHALEAATNNLIAQTQNAPQVSQAFTVFNTGSPRIAADVDRDRAQLLGVRPEQIYNALNTYLGSVYVNDFNLFGRTFRVTAQAEPAYRDNLTDIANLKVRSISGEMVPIGSVATLRNDSGPVRVVRYNLFPAAELQGQAAPRVSTGAALDAMERLAAEHLPRGMSFEWTDIALQERLSGNTTGLVFMLATVFVFLVLAAQYEAFTLPLAVILIVPMCILAAIGGVNLRGQDNNILTQIGFIVLIALAAKNAILIVEFARQAESRGLNRFDAASEAAGVRLRPILMTSFAFIFGVLPLAFAVGPAAEMRQALGTAVFFGMIGVTVFGLLFTPVFYVVCRWVAEHVLLRGRKPAVQTGAADS
jgi:hydrophobe/amphiphile efflux-1 (HAE1) family protein